MLIFSQLACFSSCSNASAASLRHWNCLCSLVVSEGGRVFEVQNKLFGTPWGPKTRPVPAFQWPYVSKSVEKPHRTSKNFLTSFYIETGILNLAGTGYMVYCAKNIKKIILLVPKTFKIRPLRHLEAQNKKLLEILWPIWSQNQLRNLEDRAGPNFTFFSLKIGI